PWKAHHAVDAGLRLQPRRARRAGAAPALPRDQGHDGDAGLVPRAVPGRSREGTRARAPRGAALGLREVLRRHGPDLPTPARLPRRRGAGRDRAVGREDGRRPAPARLAPRGGGAVRQEADRLVRDAVEEEPDALRARVLARAPRARAARLARAH